MNLLESKNLGLWALISNFLFLILISCQGPKDKIPEMPPSIQPKKIAIYQMMTRLFGNQLSANKPYGTIQENGVGRMNDITDVALKSIRELGITHVWYTGIIEHAGLSDNTKNGIPLDDADIVKGRAGSPYAIKDYYDVDPDLASDITHRMNEFESLVDRTHQVGLKAIIDFVPNHVARAYKSDVKPLGVRDLGEDDDKSVSFSPKNNFYYLPGQSFQPPHDYVPLGDNPFPTKDGKFEETPAKATGNDQFTASPTITDWFETAKLNYGVDIQQGHSHHFNPIPDTWEKMRDILLFWTGKKVDGFRCDMVEMVPVEFWQWVIPQIKKENPGILFIGEIYNPAQYRNYLRIGGFDFLYDKVQLYDTLRMLINQQARSTDIPRIQEHLRDINSNMLHFLENHDEQRIASSYFAGDPWKAVPAMVISATIDQGPVMIYFGQEVGEPGAGISGFSGEDGRTTVFDYWGVPEHQKWMNQGKFDGGQLTNEQKQLRQFYGDILQFASSHTSISDGGYSDLTIFNVENKNMSDKINAFARADHEEGLIILSSFNKISEHIRIKLTPEATTLLKLKKGERYIGRDLLRSGSDIGLDNDFSFEVDIPPFQSFIYKIK
jgi:glycosidase